MIEEERKERQKVTEKTKKSETETATERRDYPWVLGLADPGLDDIDGHRRKRARERQK